MYPTLGTVIRHRRVSLGLKQRDLAEAIDREQKYISMLENDQTRFPEPHIIRGLAEVLDCRPSDILSEIGYTDREEENEDLEGVQLYTHLMDHVDRADVPDHVRELMRQTIRTARIIHEEQQSRTNE